MAGGTCYWDPYLSSTDTSIPGTYSGTGTSFATSDYYIPRIQRLLVPRPENWTDKNQEAFLRLVNIETTTGWKVLMVITGEILVTDPNIEVRSIENFFPLIKENACQKDRIKINEFIEKNPIK